MLPRPTTLLEAVLWEIHERLTDAQLAGSHGIGAIDDEAKAAIASYVLAGPEHVTALASFLKRLDAELASLEAERSRCAALIEQAEADRRRFRSHALNALRGAGIERACGVVGALSLGRVRPSLEVRDARAIPDEFARVLPERRELRVREAEAEFARGGSVPGVVIVRGETTLVVR